MKIIFICLALKNEFTSIFPWFPPTHTLPSRCSYSFGEAKDSWSTRTSPSCSVAVSCGRHKKCEIGSSREVTLLSGDTLWVFIPSVSPVQRGKPWMHRWPLADAVGKKRPGQAVLGLPLLCPSPAGGSQAGCAMPGGAAAASPTPLTLLFVACSLGGNFWGGKPHSAPIRGRTSSAEYFCPSFESLFSSHC